jgi:ferredoxin-NADP reductase
LSVALHSSEQTASTQTPVLQAVASQELIHVQVESIRFGTHDTNLYELRPVDGAVLPPSQAGAHIGVHLSAKIVRQYSLLQAHDAPRSYLIGVKRDARSRGGSSFIHEKLRVGDVLAIEPPRNNFPLLADAPHTLLLAGGIGITPMLCMWRQLRALGRQVRLVYSCRSRRDALFLDMLEGDPNVTLRFDDEHGGSHLDLAPLLASAPRDAHLYCCGPLPMLQNFERLAAAWPAGQVHVEYFTPAQEQATEGGFTVKLARAGISISVVAGQSVLAALRSRGIETASSCEEGICGACETKVLAGIPDHRDAVLTVEEKLANNKMMICCSGSKTPELVLDL